VVAERRSGTELLSGRPVVLPAQPSATALQRGDSARSQPLGAAAAGSGHIRLAASKAPSAQCSQPPSQQQQQQQADGQLEASYDIGDFLAQVDRRLRGEPEPGPAASQPAAPATSAAAAAALGPAPVLSRGGSGGVQPCNGGSERAVGVSLLLQSQDVRLPPLAPGQRFEDEYAVLMLIDQREQLARIKGQGVRAALDSHLATVRWRWWWCGGIGAADAFVLCWCKWGRC
jgi:hypothetical protein